MASHGHTACLVGWTPLLILLKKHLLLFFPSSLTSFYFLGVYPALFPGFSSCILRSMTTPSMWGITNTSSTCKLLREVSKFPLGAVLVAVPNQLCSLRPQTWSLWCTLPAACGDHRGWGRAWVWGAGCRRLLLHRVLRPPGRLCALHPVSAPKAQPPCGRRLPRARPTSPLPAFLCHRELDVILTHHTPEGNQISLLLLLRLHGRLPWQLTVSSPCKRFPPHFSAFSRWARFCKFLFCLVFTWKIRKLFLLLSF